METKHPFSSSYLVFRGTRHGNLKQRHYFANKGPSSQSFGVSSSHLWMWEWDYKENRAPKNWCSWIVVLEKAIESPLDQKEIKPVHPQGNQSWIFIGSTVAEAEAPIVWSPDSKNWLIWKNPNAGKDWVQEEKGMTEEETVGWHHQLDGHKYSTWGCKELDVTEWLNWTETQEDTSKESFW